MIRRAREGCPFCNDAELAGDIITAYDNPESNPPTKGISPEALRRWASDRHAPSPDDVAARPAVNFERVHAAIGRRPGETAADWLERTWKEKAEAELP